MTTDTRAPSTIAELAEGYWQRFLELSPGSATVIGDTRYDDRLPDPGPEGRAKGRRLAEGMRAGAASVPTEGLAVEERITRDVIAVIAEILIAEDDRRLDELQVVDQMGGPQTMLP